jgi:broad specificity phosphatase PhoE
MGRNPMRRVVLVVLLAVQIACSSSPVAPGERPSDGGAPPTEAELLRSVASGGYVLFFRHAERDADAMGTVELAMVDNEGACVPGSELTAQGMRDSLDIGAGLQRHRVRVDRVYASPTCRTTQMAALAFGTFETTRALTWPDMWTEGEKDSLTRMLRDLLSSAPAPRKNNILVSHNNVLQAGRIGLDVSLDQGEACVFRPIAGSGFRLVGRISRQRWSE